MIKEYFNKEPLKTINADEVVAYGATIVALYENSENMINEMITIKEITSLSIGIDVKGGYMKKIIPKGTLLPKINEFREFKQTFNFPEDTKKDIIVKIYEGEDTYANENHLLGKFIISKEYNKDNKFEKNKKKIDLVMKIDHNSILIVSAQIKGNPIKIIKNEEGNIKEIYEFEINNSEFLNDEQIQDNAKRLEFIQQRKLALMEFEKDEK